MWNKLLPSFILYLADRNYYKALKYCYEYRHIPESEQRNKLIKLLNHCRQNIPYYADKLSPDEPFEKIPFLTKDLIKANIKTLRATNLPSHRFKNNSTSGSTGEAMRFYSDKLTDVYRHSWVIVGEQWAGGGFAEPKVVLWAAPNDVKQSKRIKTRLANSKLLFNTDILSAFNLSDEDLFQYVNIINKRKPKIIVGYPSTLDFIAVYLKKNNIKIHNPNGIIVSAETLQDFQRENIESVFKCKVFNRYGCRDVGIIAHECSEHNGLHIISNHVLVEIIDENGNTCKSGELGEIVVTDLDNYVFPFIRYKIGDLGVLSSKKNCMCGCNFPLLKRIEGRIFDIIVAPNGRRLPGTFFSIMLKKLFTGIVQFQIIQNEQTSISFRLKVDTTFNLSRELLLKEVIKKELGEDMKIKINYVDKFELTKSGKFRWIVSKVSPFAK